MSGRIQSLMKFGRLQEDGYGVGSKHDARFREAGVAISIAVVLHRE